MSANLNPSDFYSDKKYKINLNRYKTDDVSLNQKLDVLQTHLNNGFTLYSTRIMERFLKGHNDIPDFGIQFVMLEEYYSKHNKYSNSEEQYILAVFNENRITTDYNGFYTTETFNVDVLKDFYEVI